MGRPSKTLVLAVWMNGEFVGTWKLANRGEPEFAYDEAWFGSPAFRSLSLSLPATPANPVIRGQFVSDFFDNLLPDSEPIRKRLQAKFQTPGRDAFSLLAAVGRDCAGAVQLLEPGQPPEDIAGIYAEPLDELGVQAVLKNAVHAPGPLSPRDEDDLRISIAGAQEKTALLWHNGGWCKPRGSTPTTHILKLPLGLVGARQADMSTSVENEWMCSRILHAYGIPAASCSIRTFGHTKCLVVERLDRRLARSKTHWLRLPQEDFCQATATAADNKYEADGGPGMVRICRLLAQSTRRNDDIRTFLKTQLVFWMLRATDGHAKNFSVVLEAGDRFHLTPMYDVLSAWPVIGNGQNLIPARKVRMAMAWLGKNRHYVADQVRRRYINTTALKCGFAATARELVDEVLQQTPHVIEQVRQELPAGFPPHLAETILAGLHESAVRLAHKETSVRQT
ncbi:MAG: type II toxin-antitoxin system HipA family toxin [Sulfuricaulis sp.]|uniref:type II toxin-antitoxin system HipA family toxin n=1 Tax=Sulfuricaulis sp. TaxID=2003553 RepID=UPI0034A59242